ncbi:CHASE2 domain-containing protein [Nitratireductor sp. GCM10026969]|uniref:CHASE2 domain-containing protein n=1 Tax=Nitratireductor sp. GCM10026969 TaxID=3252645 RepID=UPI003618B0F1
MARNRHKAFFLWIAGLLTLSAIVIAAASAPRLSDHLGNLVFDAYQRLQPRMQAGAPVVVVDIDESSITEIGQWPWPRTTIAALVDRLGELGAAAIAFDMVFSEADRMSPARAIAALKDAGVSVTVPQDATMPDNDAVLAEAFARNPVVAGIAISDETGAPLSPPKAGFAFGGVDPTIYLPAFRGGVANLPVLERQAAGLGFFSFPLSNDGVVRSLPLLATAQGNLYPSLSIEALRVAQGGGSFVVRSTGASRETDTGHTAMTALKAGALAMPTGPQGQFRIYYSGMPEMTTVSAAALLGRRDEEALRSAVDGHIVLIGTSAVGLRDIVATPFQEATAGVRVHAEIIDQIMGQVFLTRPDWVRGAELFLALLFGLVILGVEWRAGALVSSLAAVALLAAAVGLSWLSFSRGHLLISPILPGGAVLGVFAVTMPVLLLMTDREKRFIRGAFGRYLSPSLVGRLANNPGTLRLGGEMRDLTVLFSDIRGFTSLSENLDPDALTRLLNDFLTPATDVLLESEATIDKYIGDAIMAFWNAPLDIADHPRKACLAALHMLDAVEALNRRSGHGLTVGIGLHTGPCCVGNLGSAQRFSYSAIGDSVNLASRVEGLTKQYGVTILVTEETRRGAADLAFVEADLVRVVGRKEPVPLHVLVGDAAQAHTPAFEAFAAAHGRFLAHYRRAEVDAAEAALAHTRRAAPVSLNKLYDFYARRLSAMRQDPPGADWDGVFVAEQK